MGSPWITGICVRKDRLEWTVLRRVKESWERVSQGMETLAPAEEGGAVWNAAALKPFLKRFKGRLAISLSGDRVLLRMAALPSTDLEELRGMADLQTDKFSPYPVETMSSGTEVLSASESSALVAMAAVQREVVEEAGGPFQELGMLPDAVDVEPLDWWWGLKQAGVVPARGARIFVRSAAWGVDMAVARDGMPLAFRSLPVPTGADAEGVEDCAEEIGYTLTTLETEWGPGGGTYGLQVYAAADAQAPWAAALGKALGVEVEGTHGLEELPTASEGAARRLAAASAAELTMDLAPAEWREADVRKQMKRRFLREATAFGVLCLLGLGVFFSLLNVRRGQLAGLEARVEAAEGPARQVGRIRAKVDDFAQYADRTHSALECLRVTAEAMPAGVELTSFVYRKGTMLSIRGSADDSEGIYGFIKGLEQSGLFTEVRNDGITTRANAPGGKTQTFGLTLELPGGAEEKGEGV